MITGAAGFIGFHLAKNLLSEGKELILVDNFERGKKDLEFSELLQNSKVKFYNIDITKENAFSVIKDDVISVYHLAAINGTNNFYSIPDKVLKVNAIGTINLLEWVKAKPHIKILYSSSSEVYAGSLALGLGDIPSDEKIPICIDDISNVRWSYGLSKALSEGAFFAYSSRYSIKFSIIRYHNIYGPRMGFEHVIPQFIKRITNGEIPLKVYGAHQTRAFCHVYDAVNASKLVMNNSSMDGKIIHIGNDQEEIEINYLAKMILQISLNPDDIIEYDPPEGSVARRCPNINLLRSVGYTPDVMLEVGVKETLEWYTNYFINNYE